METIKCGANPYLPIWEHVPDGEPRVFNYNGEERVYVYGSHDTETDRFCGKDYVVWSAPSDDLTDWRYDGVCFNSPNGSILYAPDVVEKNGTYYMYAALDEGEKIVVAKSDKPMGPFENPVETELGFDPAILVDDDGRVYAYWGFTRSFCAELEEDMATIKEGTMVVDMIGHCDGRKWGNNDTLARDNEFSFFEASSIRKFNDKYIFIYSKKINYSDSKNGLYENMNSFLDYCFSDSPTGGFKHGGTVSDNAGDKILMPSGDMDRAYEKCNNHGSIIEIKGQWYVFYHRRTGQTSYARQAMLEPIDIAMDKNGNVYMGRVEYKDGEPISAIEAEMTSQGAYTAGLDAFKMINAGFACHLMPSNDRPYIMPVYEKTDELSPVVNIKNNASVGFKYLNFGKCSPNGITVVFNGISKGRCEVLIDSPNGEVIAEFDIDNEGNDNHTEHIYELCGKVTGKHAVYFRFFGNDECICEFYGFGFNA